MQSRPLSGRNSPVLPAHRYFLSHLLRLGHRSVTRPFAPLSLGPRWDRISRMTVLPAFFWVLAIALTPPGSNAGRSLSRNGPPRSDGHGIVLLSHGGLPGLHARLNAHPSPRGGGWLCTLLYGLRPGHSAFLEIQPLWN